jgi:hypothetical protein
MHLFSGHVNFEFVTLCWSMLLNYCCWVYMGMGMHLFLGHVDFEFVTPCWSVLLWCCSWVYVGFGNGHR